MLAGYNNVVFFIELLFLQARLTKAGGMAINKLKVSIRSEVIRTATLTGAFP